MEDNNPDNQSSSDFSGTTIEQLRKYALYKERSDVTHDRDHAPILARGQPIECLLLGHSFFERFKTTGSTTRFGPDQAPYPEFFNAGVGGDRIGNVIYRLIEKGLLTDLKTAGVKYALLAMGTNDLANDKKALQRQHIEQYALIVEALQWACPGVKILVCGLAPKKKVRKEGIIEQSNEMLQQMVQDLVTEGPIHRGELCMVPCIRWWFEYVNFDSRIVEYLPSDPDLIDHLEPDGVHLNKSGYDMFADSLWNAYQALRSDNHLQ